MKKPFTWKDRISSFGPAFKGLLKALKSEYNFQVQVGFACIAILLGLFLGISKIEWLALLICIAGVLSSELFNSALENLVDFISPEFHKTAGKIKDLAAGAVLLWAIIAFIVGILVFVPKIYEIWLH